jgi:hypothetical protein
MRFIEGRAHFGGALLLACAVAASGCAGKASDADTSHDAGSRGPNGEEGRGGARPESDAGAKEDSGVRDGGGDASEPGPTCSGGTVLPVLGSYVDATGTEHWLRTTASATTYTRVPGGAPVPAKPPTLWRVVETCPDQKLFVAVSENATFARVDWTQDGEGLHLCVAAEEMADVNAALAAPKSDVKALGTGCKGGPWMLLSAAKDGGK